MHIRETRASQNWGHIPAQATQKGNTAPKGTPLAPTLLAAGTTNGAHLSPDYSKSNCWLSRAGTRSGANTRAREYAGARSPRVARVRGRCRGERISWTRNIAADFGCVKKISQHSRKSADGDDSSLRGAQLISASIGKQASFNCQIDRRAAGPAFFPSREKSLT